MHLREFVRDHRELIWLASTGGRMRDALWLERAQCLEAIEAWKSHEADLYRRWQSEYALHNFILDQEESTDSENEYPRAFVGPPPPMHRYYAYAGISGPPPMSSHFGEDYCY